jgi:dTDP-4-dehydrorhamnose 3,5-epimerase
MMEESIMIELEPRIEAVLQYETYLDAPLIEGVWVKTLQKHRSENGSFLEYLRISNGQVEDIPTPLRVQQISVARADPGRINAFHVHNKLEQNEIWTVIQGQLLVWLVDCRKNSDTAGIKRKIVLSGEQPAQLHIPAGVAHGYQANFEGATLLYSMDQQFNRSNPDEGRLPWDYFGAELWIENKG